MSSALKNSSAWLPPRLILAFDLMLDIAFNAGVGTLSAAELSERQGVDTRKLETILQSLSRAGLVKSVRGPNGGYCLGQERSDISLRLIAEAVLGNEKTSPFVTSLSPSMHKVVLPAVEHLHHTLLAEMSGISLAALCEASRQAGLRRRSDGVSDYVI